MSEELTQAFQMLHDAYGSHVAAARELKISPQHYRYLRNSGAKVPPMTEAYIVSQAKLANHDAQSMSLSNSGQPVTV